MEPNLLIQPGRRDPKLCSVAALIGTPRIPVADERERTGLLQAAPLHQSAPMQTMRGGSGFDTFLIVGYQYPGINP
jgi:hypothetical protein